MKSIDFATIGIRLVGIAAIAFGVVLAMSCAAMNLVTKLSLVENSISADLHLHDTYYVITRVHYDLLIPSGIGLGVGVVLVLLSRRLAGLIVRGLAAD